MIALLNDSRLFLKYFEIEIVVILRRYKIICRIIPEMGDVSHSDNSGSGSDNESKSDSSSNSESVWL
nr:unnamed protein product [Callosobruchus analis]